jgi:hypothetical protein
MQSPKEVLAVGPQAEYIEAMALRKGIYLVPTDRWYIERTVWLIAGVVLVSCTLLAVLVNPLWIIGVIATGLVSINVALTGFCPIGNVLLLLGFKPALGQTNRGSLYFLQTDSWYLERRIYVTVGVNIILGSILLLTVSPWWGLFTGFVGAAMVWFASTGLCILANVLYWIGAEPRLNPGALRSPRIAGAKHA